MGTETICVMGAGVMGSGIAQVMALAGHDVVCYDVADEALEKGRGIVDTGRFGVRSAVDRGKLTSDEADAALARITFSKDFDQVAGTDAVIEAATDRPEKVVGWHWASPAPVMKLAEIVRAPQTSDATIETIVRIAAGAGGS